MSLKKDYTKLEAVKMLQAFVLFRKEGMQAVTEMYPEYKQFVKAHKEKSEREVRNLLLSFTQHQHS